MVYALNEVMKATGGRLVRGPADRVFDGISTDTRAAAARKLFVPLKGEKYDGHAFIGEALKQGATGLLIREGEEGRLRDIGGDITVVSVPDTLTALGDLARHWRKRYPVPLIAITGSAGKTTTKEMTARVVGMAGKTLKTEGNFNNLVGLPLTLFRLTGEHKAAVVEMGTNVPGEIEKLCRIALPEVGLITNIGPAHLEGLKSLRMVQQEKGEIFRNLAARGTAVVNQDDEAVRALAARWPGKRVTYGLGGAVEVGAEDIEESAQGVSFILKVGEDRKKVSLAVAGCHNVMNALAAAAAGRALGLDGETIRLGLKDFPPIRARMEIHRLQNDAFLIDDSYNANPLSVREALRALKTLRGSHRGTAILGDMLELGARASEFHREIGELAAQTGLDALFLQGDYSRETAAGAERKGFSPDRIFFPATMEEMINDRLEPFLRDGGWVLVKGSRATKMEEVVRTIIGRWGLQNDAAD